MEPRYGALKLCIEFTWKLRIRSGFARESLLSPRRSSAVSDLILNAADDSDGAFVLIPPRAEPNPTEPNAGKTWLPLSTSTTLGDNDIRWQELFCAPSGSWMGGDLFTRDDIRPLTLATGVGGWSSYYGSRKIDPQVVVSTPPEEEPPRQLFLHPLQENNVVGTN